MKNYLLSALLLMPVTALAQEKDVQDMSDPLAVYTQVGLGATNKGLNIKIGSTYDSGSAITMAMNIIEVKGIAGEALGWDYSYKKDDEIDSFRLRNFTVNMKTGRGSQIDLNYNMDGNPLLAERTGDVSYSVIQALPKMGVFNLYPLLGLGTAFGLNANEVQSADIDEGYSVYGIYTVLGMYGKITISDKIWFNYNPIWLATVGGSDNYKDNAYGLDQDSIFLHEFAASYQFTPTFNVRYFANWNEEVDFEKGDHRLEFNWQL